MTIEAQDKLYKRLYIVFFFDMEVIILYVMIGKLELVFSFENEL